MAKFPDKKGPECPPGTFEISASLCQASRPPREVNSREDCYAGLSLGPISGPAEPSRRGDDSCPATTAYYISLRGRNIGFTDAVVSVNGNASISTPDLLTVPQDQRGTKAACAGPDCRFVKLDLPKGAADLIEIGIAFPDRPQTTMTTPTRTGCPAGAH